MLFRSSLAQAERALRDAAQHDKRLPPLLAQIQSARILAKEIALALRDYSSHTDVNPAELARAQTRLAELEKLHRKYGPDLAAYHEKLRAEMDSIGLMESRIDEIQKKMDGIKANYESESGKLSKVRQDATATLESRIESQLASLSMTNTRFRIALEKQNVPGPRGMESVLFRISANPGEEPRPLDRKSTRLNSSH